MTALVSLATRLSLAQVALYVRADQATVAALEPVLAAGVDLLVLGGSGDVDLDVGTIREFRQKYAHTRLLLGTDSDDVAVPAAADVVHFKRRHWLRGHTKGHQWSLRGFNAGHGAALAHPGNDFDYVFVGPLTDRGEELLASAVRHQPPLTVGALPWFAMVGSEPDEVATCMAAGARRVALSGEVLDQDGACDVVAGVAAAVEQAWAADERTPGYRMEAFRG